MDYYHTIEIVNNQKELEKLSSHELFLMDKEIKGMIQNLALARATILHRASQLDAPSKRQSISAERSYHIALKNVQQAIDDNREAINELIDEFYGNWKGNTYYDDL